jgi:hypothetical protein
MKICSACRTEKQISGFYIDRSSKSGLTSRCKNCIKSYQNIWRKDNKGKKAKANTSWYYRKTHGITPAEFVQRAKEQHNKCKICLVDLTFDAIKDNRAVMDHCHSTGEKRGVLCYACNLGLGKFKDSVDALSRAVNYLKEYKN